MNKVSEQVHGSCVCIDESGLLLRGPSASGKSDLALRLIDRGARLVADDRVDLARAGDIVFASAPQVLQGLLEVRTVGILKYDFLQRVRLSAVIDLHQDGTLDRLPAAQWLLIAGVQVPHFRVFPWGAAAALKVELVSGLVSGSITRTDD